MPSPAPRAPGLRRSSMAVTGSMSASDDIERSVEESLEEFVSQANAAFAEDFDGWDIAQTTNEVRLFQQDRRQQGEAARKIAEITASLEAEEPKKAPPAAEAVAVARGPSP